MTTWRRIGSDFRGLVSFLGSVLLLGRVSMTWKDGCIASINMDIWVTESLIER